MSDNSKKIIHHIENRDSLAFVLQIATNKKQMKRYLSPSTLSMPLSYMPMFLHTDPNVCCVV